MLSTSALTWAAAQDHIPVWELITDALKANDSVQLVGFGTFEVKTRAARTGKNPRTGEAVEVAAKKVPAFKPGKALKNTVK